jgi:Na+/proline symporter
MRLRALDFAVIVVYLIGITAFGAHFRKWQHTLKDYFLGGRTVPWWAIALSIVSAETSILTIIDTPATPIPWSSRFPASGGVYRKTALLKIPAFRLSLQILAQSRNEQGG